MTTILGLRSGGVNYLAADSRICTSDPMPATINKIAQRGEWAIGVSGIAALVNLVHDHDGDPGPLPKELVEWLRAALAKADWKADNEPGAKDYGSWSIIAANYDGIYDISSNLSYCRVDDGSVWARGSGMEYARGAATAFLMSGMSVRDAITATFEIVARFDPGTDNRVQIVSKAALNSQKNYGFCQCGGEIARPLSDKCERCLVKAGAFCAYPELRSGSTCNAVAFSEEVLGYPDAMTARAQGACPQCGWKENSHSVSC